MHIKAGCIGLTGLLWTALTARSIFAEDECKADPYKIGFDGQSPEEAVNDVQKLWPRKDDARLSHVSRTLSLSLAYTQRDYINQVFKNPETPNSFSYCDIKDYEVIVEDPKDKNKKKKERRTQNKSLHFKIHEPDATDLTKMIQRDITVNITQDDFINGANGAKKAVYIWPLLIHKIHQQLENEKAESTVLRANENTRVDCNIMGEEAGKQFCAIGSLIARFTGQVVRVTDKITEPPGPTIAPILVASKHFPIVALSRNSETKWAENDILTDNQPIGNKVKFRSPNPKEKEEEAKDKPIFDGLWQSAFERYLLYPDNYAQLQN